MPRVLVGSQGGGYFLMGEVPLRCLVDNVDPPDERLGRFRGGCPDWDVLLTAVQDYLAHKKTPTPLGPP